MGLTGGKAATQAKRPRRGLLLRPQKCQHPEQCTVLCSLALTVGGGKVHMGKGQGILPHGDPCRWSRALKSAPASANITRPTHTRMLSCRVHGSLTVIIMDMHAPPPPVAAAERGGADKPTVGVHTEPTLATPNPSTPECSRLQYPQHGVRTTAEAFPLPPLPSLAAPPTVQGLGFKPGSTYWRNYAYPVSYRTQTPPPTRFFLVCLLVPASVPLRVEVSCFWSGDASRTEWGWLGLMWGSRPPSRSPVCQGVFGGRACACACACAGLRVWCAPPPGCARPPHTAEWPPTVFDCLCVCGAWVVARGATS